MVAIVTVAVTYVYVYVCVVIYMIVSSTALFNDRYNDQVKNETTVTYTSVFSSIENQL